MLQITPQMRILVAVEAVDFRKGIDGLARVCSEQLQEDPFSGYVFIFRNKGFRALKILMYDGQGYWLAQKRLSRGRYSWWPKEETKMKKLTVAEFQLLLWNGSPENVSLGSDWQPIKNKKKLDNNRK